MLIYPLVAFPITDKISYRNNFRAFLPSGFQEITGHQVRGSLAAGETRLSAFEPLQQKLRQ